MSQTKPSPSKAFAAPTGEHVSLGGLLRFVLVVIPAIFIGVLLLLTLGNTEVGIAAAVVIEAIVVVFLAIIVSGVRVAAQWERGVILRLGRYAGVRGPGLLYVIPVLEYVRFIDNRVLALNIPGQRVITKDNVPAMVDGVIFFYVADAQLVVTKVQDFTFAIAQYAQASLRDVIGSHSLDDLLTEREQIQEMLGEIVEQRIKEWGIHIDSIRLLDIDMPEELKRMMSRQASAEREKRATITKAEGDKVAAINLAEAAKTMATSPGAMQLRTLQTLDGLGAGASNTVVLFPTELTDMADKIAGLFPKPVK
ncbi:MAG: slipin family protein [Rubrobacteridae bacterium]|nr:slipin family protein [Rubrobacteridae bacterium]